MAASAKDGPEFTYGSMSALQAAMTSPAGPVPDPNQDAGPNGMYQGNSLLDPRYWFAKDKVTGYTGVVAAHFMLLYLRSVNRIPFAVASNNIAAAQNVVSGTAMTLAAASGGVDTNMPIWPFNQANISGPGANQSATTAAMVLDFGLSFGATTAGSATITGTAAPASVFSPGMPIVIAGVGNAAGTIPLLTNVLTVNFSTSVLTVGPNVPLATSTGAAIGTGNLWSPSEAIYLPGQGVPTAALPYVAAGPSLIFDARQGLARGVQIVGAAGGSGGAFLVSGWDNYSVPMSELVTVGAGAVTGWGKKAFKYIAFVVPQFTDAHNYSVGTSDVFGINYRCSLWDDTNVTWDGSSMTTSTGFVAPLGSATASTTTTADVRGTIQTSTNGGGSGISGGSASNGSLTGTSLSGRRLKIENVIQANQAIRATPSDFSTLFGTTQA